MIFILLRIPSLLPNKKPIPYFKFQALFLYHSSSNSSKVEKFASLLDNSGDEASLRKLHACIFTHGLCQNTLLGSKLVTSYLKFGFLAEPRWVFDRITNNNLILWNSVIVGYFRIGQYSEVLRLYINLRQKNIGLDSSAITFSFKSCAELGSFEFGKRVHADAFKFRLSTNGFVGSSIIGFYSKLGDIDSASKVFEEITDRDVVVHTSIITAYAQQNGQLASWAFEFAHRMQKEEIDPNRVTLVSLLQAAAELEALEEGRTIHGYAIRRGIGCGEEVFETSLMDMYIKCKVPKVAGFVFGRMKMRMTGSWNAIITGYLQMGYLLEAFEHFCMMVEASVFQDLISLGSGILACAELKYLQEGKSIHGHIIRIGYQLDLVAATALTEMYAKCNNMIQARKLFDRMETRDVISYNVMMAGYLQNESATEAVQIFTEMVGMGCKPNRGSILTVLSAFSDLKNITAGRILHGYIVRHEFYSTTEVSNQIIYMYARCGSIFDGRRVFDSIRCKDLISWTSVMMGYVYNGLANEAIMLFRLLKGESLDHDSITMITLLQAFSQIGNLSLTMEVHSHLYKALMERETPLINSLITTYAKLGKLDMARNLFEHTSRGCLTSWNTMISAYGMHGKCIEALRIFDRMKKECIKPDGMTFTSILTACSHSGLVEDGLQIVNCMIQEYSMVPGEEHYACIVDLLSRAGRLEEAYDLVRVLPARQSAHASNALLASCRMHGNKEMGELIGNHILDLEPDNPIAYNLVSNLYAENGKWDAAARIRNMARKRGLKKSPGYSLIELHHGAL